jgi:hypothetical protein
VNFTFFIKNKGALLLTVLQLSVLFLVSVSSGINAGLLNRETGRVTLPDYNQRMKMHVNQGDYAYIGGYSGYLYILNLANKSAPTVMSRTAVATGGNSWYNIHDVWYNYNYLYLAHRDGGVSKAGVFNLTNPQIEFRCMYTGYTHNGLITSRNPATGRDVLYVADHYSNLPAFRAYDPYTNVQIGTSPINDDGREIEVTTDGRYLFQATWETIENQTPCIRIYDVSNAAMPVYRNRINVFAHEMVMSPDNQYLYIVYDQPADNKIEGVMILDISNPTTPTIVNEIHLPGARDITVDHIRKRLFVRTRSDLAANQVPTGIYAYDFSDVQNIVRKGFRATESDREDFDLWYYQDYLYYTDNTSYGSQLIILNIPENSENEAPTAYSQSIFIGEDYNKSLVISGSDPDLDALQYTITAQPQHGSLTGTAPNLTYVPFANYNGSDEFKFTVSDGALVSNQATVSITIYPINDFPLFPPIPDKTVDENSTLSFTVLATDVDGDALTFNLQPLPYGANLSSSGDFTWTPTFQQAGTYRIYIEVNDGLLISVQWMTIIVKNVNCPPVANAQSVTTNEDNAKTIYLSGSDPDGQPVTCTVVTQPANGTLSGTPPAVAYTPNANYNGSDVFTFRVSDGSLSSAEATVSITVNPVNDAPVLTSPVTWQVDENSALSFNVTGSDVDGDALTFSVTNLPSGMTFTNNTFNWTPNFNQAGTYYTSLSVSDGAISQPYTVKITVNNVNRAPVANAQSITTNEDNAKAIVLTGSDPDGGAVTYSITVPPTKGILSGTAPNLTYSPNANYNGSDAFTFTVSDGDLSAQATVSITVNPVNDAPVLNSIAAQSVNENAPLTFTATGSDIDGDALTFSATSLPTGATLNANGSFTWTPTYEQSGNYSVTISVSDGKLSASQNVTITVSNINRKPVANAQNVTTNEDNAVAVTLTGSDPDGEALTYAVTAAPAHGTLSGSAPNFTYTPNANYNGSDVITFSVSDGDLSAQATVSITVNPVNDAPVLNSIAAQSVNENAQLTFTATGSDIDGDALTFSATSLPTGATLNASGSFTWTPTYVQSGNYSMIISVSDGKLSASQNVTITVSNINRKPVANAQNVTTNEDNAVAVTLTGSDPDGEALTYAVTAAPAHGALSGSAPNLTYTPNANYNGSDAITFAVSDGDLSTQATVSITVNAVNDKPVLNTIASQSVEETSTLTFTATGSDIDEDALTFSAADLPSGATFENGTFTWTPTWVQAGSYSVAISVNDGNETVSQVVAITVSNLNRAPVADAQSVTTNEDNAVAITLTGSDPDGEALTYTVTAEPAHGTLSGTAPNLTYTPDANYNGSDAFTFSVSDGALSAHATVSITVNAVNDKPVLNTIASQSVEETSTLTFTAAGSDIDEDALTFSAADLPSGATFENGTFTWTPTWVQAGSYSVAISVNDGNETVSQVVAITVSNLNRAPVADAQSVTTNEDNAVAITLTGSDPDGEALTYTVTAEPAHGTLSGTAPNLTYTPDANYNGSDAFTFSVSDGALSAHATVSITVNAVNDKPVLNTIASQSVEETSTLTFTAAGSDIDEDALTFSAADLPSGATFENGTFTWTPTWVQAGSYSVAISVNDGNETVSQVVAITVSNLNRAPAADAQSVTTNEDNAVAITLTGSDPDGEALTYTVTAEPAHGTLSGTAPNLTYTPDANYNGSDAITFSVSDGDLSAHATVSITVNAVNDKPVLNTISDKTAGENSELTFTATGSDIDGDALTFSATNLPARAKFADGTFTWTPAFDQAGSYTVTVSVTDGKLTTSQNVKITVTNTNAKTKVYMYDEAMSNPAASNPRLYVVNVSNEIIHGCRIEYYFTADNGKVPQLDLYYTANAKVTLAQRGNGDYTIVYDLTGIDLAPGAVFPNQGGMVVGISYKDWSTVNVTNDYSNNQARSYIENSRICVYNSDNRLLGGLKPANTSILPFADAGKDVWSLTTQVRLDASHCYDLLGEISAYEWKINGSVVSTAVSPILSFSYGATTVTLKVTNADGLSSTDEVKVYVQRDTEILFAASPDPVPQNTPVTVEYNIPSRMAGCAVQLIGYNAWGGTSVVTLNSSTGYHNEKIWSWDKGSFGGSGPWTVKCKVNGVITQTFTIKFNY